MTTTTEPKNTESKTTEPTAAKSPKKKVKKKDALATTGPTGMAQFEDYGSDVGVGYGEETANDIQIPRIAILQALSPQVEKPTSEGGVEGAKPGLFYHTLDGSLSESVSFVIGKIEKCYNEWVPRDKGGGFVQRHELDSDLVREEKKKTPRGTIELANGNELLETILMYIIPLDDKGEPVGGFAVLDYVKSKLSAWRGFNTLLRSFTIPQPGGRKAPPPIFAHTVMATTKRQAFDKGTAYNYVLQPRKDATPFVRGKNGKPDVPARSAMENSLIPPSHLAFRQAKELAGLVEQGFAKVQDMGVQDESDSSAGEVKADY